MSHIPITVNPAIGDAFGGGFFAGRHPTQPAYALIVAPKVEGQATDRLVWSRIRDRPAPGARSLDDGFTNSESVNDDDHPAIRFCRGLTIGGFDDWYLPSLEEMSVLRRTLLPRAGGNPEQTTAAAFREGGTEAFDTNDWYWTSTEFAPGSAWLQYFHYGAQTSDYKCFSYWVRAVRKCLL